MITAVVSTNAIPRVLIQVRDEHVDAVQRLCRDRDHGLLVTGQDALEAVGRLRVMRSPGGHAVDHDRYRDAVATPDAPIFLHDSPGGLFEVPITSQLAAQRDTGSAMAVLPTLFLRAGDLCSVEAAVCVGNTVSESNVVLHAPLDRQWLAGGVGRLGSVLSGSRHRVALTFVGQYDPVSTAEAASAVRELVTALPGCLLFRVDPLVALDAIAHGAHGAAVGVVGSLRHAVRPGTISKSSGGSRVPSIFMRALLSLRRGDMFQRWYANDDAPRCRAEICNNRPIDTYTASTADRLAAVIHNAHSWVDLADELLAQPAAKRRQWLHNQRLDALTAHDWLPGTSGVKITPVKLLKAYETLGP